jgi:S4 domain protein YaaA
MQTFTLSEEFITLGQLIKMLGLIATGGEIKFYLIERGIRVNGELESRRGRKLYAKDVVEIEGETPIEITA